MDEKTGCSDAFVLCTSCQKLKVCKFTSRYSHVYFVFQAAEFRDCVMSERVVKLIGRNQWLIFVLKF